MCAAAETHQPHSRDASKRCWTSTPPHTVPTSPSLPDSYHASTQVRKADARHGHTDDFVKYESYLSGLAKSLPFALLHVAPFESSGDGIRHEWQALRQPPEVLQQV